ncbi:MAG: head-tail connector protein, partial [Lachnospiraceae bacterium]|nr:head-tail connector protein [Muribaculaceae bacterium]MCM1412315.1 head-tail connector protein [Lachnospiraceae bacterium]
NFITAAEKQCMDILRTDDEADLAAAQNGKTAVMFTVAYLYEHREEADHHAMDLTLRALLFGSRKEGF